MQCRSVRLHSVMRGWGGSPRQGLVARCLSEGGSLRHGLDMTSVSKCKSAELPGTGTRRSVALLVRGISCAAAATMVPVAEPVPLLDGEKAEEAPRPAHHRAKSTFFGGRFDNPWDTWEVRKQIADRPSS
jgi:hypothetical protein